MPNMFASEFPQELDDDLIARLTRGITQRGAQRQGAVTRDVLERGLATDPYEASARGLAQSETDSMIGDLEADFAYRKAGLQREERLIGQDQQFVSGEAQKGRDFKAQQADQDRALQRYLAEMGISYQREQSDDAFTNALIGAGGHIVGGLLSRRGGS